MYTPHAFGIPISCLKAILALRFRTAVCGMVWILSGIAEFIYYIGQQDAAYWENCHRQRRAREPGLEIISGGSLDI